MGSDKLCTAPFTVASAGGGTVGLNGSDTSVICQGDAGGPALRVNNGVPELVAVNSRSWQGGCLGTDPKETCTGAENVRVDDLGAWIRKTAFRAQGDMNGDRVADLAAIWGDGRLFVYPGDKDKELSGDEIGQIGGNSWKTTLKIAKGDFTGNGTADIVTIWVDGTMRFYKGKGDGQLADGKAVSRGGNTWKTTPHMTARDLDGDGIADLMAIWGDSTLHRYKGDFADGTLIWGGNTWKTILKIT